ncbi:hypothetical protein GCM10025865_26330 [Paraoerskovia sediminicola]|uniref:Uncharacterized protein n=1 Tax=Paraoerskovia sediminicola TaxID=1138587 RepID=A0ABN6XEQ0_9CELL|nr:hypothetical protein [Paraoerskovia sediminicola]BDZ43334.1 hypothetical protein GCM10025865_26330 [Paraoerskovia sediminicola]
MAPPNADRHDGDGDGTDGDPGSPTGGTGDGSPAGDDRQDDGLDVERRWAAIVDELGGEGGTGPARPDPVADGVPPVPQARPVLRAGPRTGPRDWPTSAEVEALEDAESHFTPRSRRR